MEKLSKYVWLLKTIVKAKNGITLEEIKAKWEDADEGNEPLPRQTFNRWKADIASIFGIVIACDRKPYVGIYL